MNEIETLESLASRDRVTKVTQERLVADTNAATYWKRTALHWAAREGVYVQSCARVVVYVPVHVRWVGAARSHP